MKQKTLTSLSVATALGLLTPLPSYAFGLGQITLHSALNEPFRAEIAVNALRDDERGNLEVRLASTQDFERAGLDRNFLLTQLKFEVVEEANSTRIMVTSDVPIKEPFLGFLLAATTGQGKLLREYTVLLDPPKELYRDRLSSAPQRATATPQTQPPASSSRSQPTTWSPNRDVSSEYKVQSRETLWSIAERTRPSADITMQQMMIALLNANPGAFQQNNVNSLYAGSTLRIPATDEITRLSASAAKNAVDQQNAAWRNRNRSQATATAPTAVTPVQSAPANNVVPAETDAELAKAEITDTELSTTTEEQVSADETARLKLIAATEDSLLDADPEINGDPDLQRISEQLTLAQEAMEAQSQENIDFKNRMDALERQLDTMRRLISLKDADLARLQSLLEQDESQMDLAALVSEANAIIDSGSTNADTDNAELSDANQWEPVALDDQELSASMEQNNEPTTTDIETPAADNVLAQVDPTANAEDDALAALDSASAEVDAAIDEAAQMLDLEQQQMDSLFHRVQAFVMAHKVESLLAILLLLLLVWMVIRRSQREVNWDDAVNKINKKKTVKTAPEIASVATVTPVVKEPEDSVEIKTKSVDELVEQADMFVGYADYVQAGSALQQAYQQAPDDKDIAAKLMFVYYKQQKSADFIALLNTSGINENDPQWSEIRVWGNQLLPHNPLFAEAAESSDQAETVDDFAEQDDAEFSIEEDFAEEDDIETSEVEESDHIEFNLDDYQVDSTKSSQADEVYERDEEDLLPFDTSYSSVEQKAETEPESEQSNIETFAEDDDLRIDLTQDNVLQPDSSAPEVLDLSIDELDDEADLLAVEEAEETLPLDSLDSDELDLSAFETEDESPTETDDVIEDYLNLDGSIDDEELDFDLSDFDSIDEAETKLELAAAYSDMGDPEGARGILEEVLEQGTDEQKKRAQELLDSLQ
ncbi:FimV/HubP family polar landmark protein [Methylophaga sp.]|uniref:FimV/HubP family polar landmark protein n=1 Tax=Methylophaga sp. TaxID=2024840 RepID=UPI00271CA494|nr:FimV/HubP family polar landmark protein [Methylophaga sp.]MDO8825223.1 FimV/HubP family polar landmark protein [Methylophaga sp.]